MNPNLMNLLLYGGLVAIGWILAGGKLDFLNKLQPPKPTPPPEPLPNPVSPAVVPLPQKAVEATAPHDWKDQHVAIPLHDLMVLARQADARQPEVKKPDA